MSIRKDPLYVKIRAHLIAIISQYEAEDELDKINQWLDRGVVKVYNQCLEEGWLKRVYQEEVGDDGDDNDFNEFVLSQYLLAMEDELDERYDHDEELYLDKFL
jgi:hypothetical protein